MEVQLGSLIEKIKKQGVDEARKQSEAIVQEAEKKAASVLQKAEKEADARLQKAEDQSKQFQKNAELAVQQAVRDAELQLKGNIQGLFDQALKHEVSQTMDAGFIKQLILKIVDNWKPGSDIEITVNQKDKKELEKVLISSLKSELSKSVVIKAGSEISDGFRIGIKGGDVYYDFSDETVADLLKQYLNPKIKELLERDNG